MASRRDGIAGFYNRVSRLYDAVSMFEQGVVEEGLKLIDLKRCSAALDIGCGTGGVLKRLSRSCEAVAGLDIAEGMLRVARRKLGTATNVFLALGDTVHLPFRSGSFDIATAIFVLEILNNQELAKALEEVQRVLRRGGAFLAVSIYDRPCMAIKLYKVLSRLFPTVFNCRPIKLDKLLIQVGFEIVAKRVENLYGLPIMIAVASRD